ncbi:hypothetical protein AWA1501_18660 [Lactiplantibacillus pentosus]|uniref:Uncharacterized protein n=1 Tax=Lactiplantibacillus pentosus TaxID=1589 RepID=A0AAW8WD74_LACPE|nr:hypothetical protein [Lactiplantibacillus pentosus]GEO51653.1 hypothetical protein LPE01_30140 [Lactiplantibacillus pentosus]GIP69703.1 hypothetical protein AWA1501_18660 [Lactiplantibacillus pentosus]
MLVIAIKKYINIYYNFKGFTNVDAYISRAQSKVLAGMILVEVLSEYRAGRLAHCQFVMEASVQYPFVNGNRDMLESGK